MGQEDPLEKGMVTHSSILEGSGLGTRVYLWQIHIDIWQNQYNIVKLKNKIKKREFLGWRSLVGNSPRGRKESDTNGQLTLTFSEVREERRSS